MNYQSPLSVYIVWHPLYDAGSKIADRLYSSLCRNTSAPLVRTLGIPVYFRSIATQASGAPIEIPYNESENNAVILLISAEFILDPHFKKYSEDIYDWSLSNPSTRVYPVALNKGAFTFSNKLSKINFVKTDIEVGEEQLSQASNNDPFIKIKSSILHELCRILMHMKKAADEVDSLSQSPPIKLFISHSKHDDSKLEAIHFRNYINSTTQLKSFFDANDISFGSNFGEEIKRAARECALVVFQSDSYSEREWCRMEVLEAKSSGCPMVIVNAVETGEKRAFPYLGNFPSIRFKKNFSEIIDLTLEQVLFNLFSRRFLDIVTDIYGIKVDHILSSAPELFNFVQLKRLGIKDRSEFKVIIYPDPPIGTEEMILLNEIDDNYFFITPLVLPTLPLL